MTYASAGVYVLWGIVSLALFDALVSVLNRRMKRTVTLAVSSVVPGVLFYATYFPFTLYLFPWSFRPQVFSVVVLIGSMLGVGFRIYSGITTLALGKVQGQVKG